MICGISISSKIHYNHFKDKKSLTGLYKESASSSPGGVGCFRWRGGILLDLEKTARLNSSCVLAAGILGYGCHHYRLEWRP